MKTEPAQPTCASGLIHSRMKTERRALHSNQACEAQNRNQRAYSEAALKQDELETREKSARLGHVTV